MKSSVFVEGLRLYAFHGVMPQENVVGAYFVVDVEAEVDFGRAIETDDLSGTVSYADIVEVVKQEMAVTSKLLEHVAGRILKALHNRFPQIQHARVRILKENPPMGVELKGAGVEVNLP